MNLNDVMKLPLALSLCALIAAGCAGTSESSRIPAVPKPGKGIAEYREIAREAHKAVARTVDSLDTLSQVPPSQSSQGRVSAFDRAFEDLELTSIKTRARAEAIIARGQKYFDEWQEQLGTNRSSAQADYNRLFAHFSRVRERSAEVRAEFRPFMAGLRRFRATFDPLDPVKPADAPGAPTPEAKPKLQDPKIEIQQLTAGGQRVLKTLESVTAALDAAETELKTMLASKG